jgi:hypothetical protein
MGGRGQITRARRRCQVSAWCQEERAKGRRAGRVKGEGWAWVSGIVARWCQTCDVSGVVSEAWVSDVRTRCGLGGGSSPHLRGLERGGRTTRATVCRPPFKERRAPLLFMAPALRRHLRIMRRFRLRASITVMSRSAALPF